MASMEATSIEEMRRMFGTTTLSQATGIMCVIIRRCGGLLNMKLKLHLLDCVDELLLFVEYSVVDVVLFGAKLLGSRFDAGHTLILGCVDLS